LTAEQFFNKGFQQWNEANNYEEAMALFSRAIELRPNFPEAYLYRGVSRLKEHVAVPFTDAEGAIEDFEAALRLKPKWAEAHYCLGFAHHVLGSFVRSREELTTAIAHTFVNRTGQDVEVAAEAARPEP
jgi:tetratricopeptide (TPR) repeat protein